MRKRPKSGENESFSINKLKKGLTFLFRYDNIILASVTGEVCLCVRK